MRREGSFHQTAKRQLDDSIHAGRSLASRHGGVLPAYERLLWRVQTRTTLLHPSDRAGDNRNGFNSGLLALALYHGDWLRTIESWRPVQQNAWPLFSSLAKITFPLWISVSTPSAPALSNSPRNAVIGNARAPPTLTPRKRAT